MKVLSVKSMNRISCLSAVYFCFLSCPGLFNEASAQNPGRSFDGKRARVAPSQKKEEKEKFSENQKEAALYTQKDPAFKNLVLGVQKNQARDFKKAEKYLLTCLAESSKPPIRKEWVPFREKTIKRALQELQAIQSLYKSLGMKKKSDHLYKNVLIPWNTKIYGNKSIQLKTLRRQNQVKVIRPNAAQIKLYKSKEALYKKKAERKKQLLKEAYAKIEAEYKKNAPKQKTTASKKAPAKAK